MMGVVLWSDLEDQKAVFWCEDHGDLAYYDATNQDGRGKEMLHPGDMVRFDVFVESKVRRAENAFVVHADACVGLPDHLRAAAHERVEMPAPVYPQNVVPFMQRRPA